MSWKDVPLRCDNVSCEKVLTGHLVCGPKDTIFCSDCCHMQYLIKNDRIYRMLKVNAPH